MSATRRLSRRAFGCLVLAGLAETSGCRHKEKSGGGAAGARLGMVLADSGAPFDHAVERATRGFAEEQSITLFDGVFDAKDPDKYAKKLGIEK